MKPVLFYVQLLHFGHLTLRLRTLRVLDDTGTRFSGLDLMGKRWLCRKLGCQRPIMFEDIDGKAVGKVVRILVGPQTYRNALVRYDFGAITARGCSRPVWASSRRTTISL